MSKGGWANHRSDICMKLESKIERCRILTKSLSWDQLKGVQWMNKRATHNRAYIPTKVEHLANMMTHGVCMMPSVLAACELLRRSGTVPQYMAAIVYGVALSLLFAISTSFHSVFYCKSDCQMKNVLHRCDRAMIYVFIAGSYFPWLTVGSPAGPVLQEMRWIVWLLATLGIGYQQMFHEKYKRLETIFYLITGIGPSVVIVLSDHEFSGMGELKLGGLLYAIGLIFFKCDGVIPFAHAIWHIFVAVAACIHYMAVLNNLYPVRDGLGMEAMPAISVDMLQSDS